MHVLCDDTYEMMPKRTPIDGCQVTNGVDQIVYMISIPGYFTVNRNSQNQCKPIYYSFLSFWHYGKWVRRVWKIGGGRGGQGIFCCIVFDVIEIHAIWMLSFTIFFFGMIFGKWHIEMWHRQCNKKKNPTHHRLQYCWWWWWWWWVNHICATNLCYVFDL